MLLDADVVIGLFEIGIWEKLVDRTRVTLSQQVLDEAQHYYDSETMARKCINLQPYVDEAKIDVLACDAQEVAPVRSQCCKFAILHPGELESLAILNRIGSDALFCTADRGAIRAAVMLDLAERVISLEELLVRVGLKRNFTDNEDLQYSEQAFKRAVRRASIDKVEGFGTGGQ